MSVDTSTHPAPGLGGPVRWLDEAVATGRMTPRTRDILGEFHRTHREIALSLGATSEANDAVWRAFIAHVSEASQRPYPFPPYSERVGVPHDHRAFSCAFWEQVVDWCDSACHGTENLARLDRQRRDGDNVILFGNHQTEPDPHLLDLLIRDRFPDLAREIIFVAGDRVLTDPVAIPFSMGCNLLCVYSRRRIDQPPDLREQKQAHNRRAMATLTELLSEGGRCVFVAPSGGRDRVSTAGELEIAAFDAQAVEMMLLVARQATTPTHVYPVALSTHNVFPPPPTIEVELGERRICEGGPIAAGFGAEIDVDAISTGTEDRHARRTARASHIEGLVRDLYLEV